MVKRLTDRTIRVESPASTNSQTAGGEAVVRLVSGDELDSVGVSLFQKVLSCNSHCVFIGLGSGTNEHRSGVRIFWRVVNDKLGQVFCVVVADSRREGIHTLGGRINNLLDDIGIAVSQCSDSSTRATID
ncbi:hypothetical protein OGAPHI_005807 [Ogataea philodendri]|uniref:Uncharacterized protein n=1 Tax=Ogataea philodendri TaxID=1378263 RepID=A0A9P8T234_9ASCO|nr:uncharacterized protein OGAPHI_005807 [Ogataea philodendri]KAH3662555.1 hypothetical protein OGAPHI_005807 [Ogataea philodendri]